MRSRTYFLEGLLALHTHEDREVRRGLFRQSIASLGAAASVHGPGPLEGASHAALEKSVRAAIADGLFDDLGWLAPAAAGVALYEIAGALPLGVERRDLGRRVATLLFEGNASTFAAIATRMVLGSAKGLAGSGVRARLALTFALPTRADVPVGPLALALASRRDAAREWIAAASTRSLPERRLAARVIEHAAREVAQRAGHGDDQALYLFRGALSHGQDPGEARPGPSDLDPLTAAWHTLLADREGLVWRHVAVARGLLSGVLPEAAEEMRSLLAADLSPTEWRRGAASLCAAIAVDPRRNLPRALALLEGPLLRRDPGIASAMMWGLAPAADAEPEAAEKLVDALAAASPLAIAESLVELRADVGDFGRKALDACAGALGQSLSASEADDGLSALARAILHDLSTDGREGGELRHAIRDALDAFVEIGTREAYARGHQALALAEESVAALEALDVGDEGTSAAKLSRRTSVAILRDLDASLLESGALTDLLRLDRRVGDEGSRPVDELDERLVAWLLRGESSGAGPDATVHATLHQRQLRALLHLVDGEAIEGDQQERRARVRARWLTTCRAMLERLLAERRSPLRRAVAATLARAYDALVRDSAADTSDVAIHASSRIEAPGDLEILAEASTHPDTRQLLGGFAAFGASLRDAKDGPSALAAMRTLAQSIPPGSTQRTEVLRGAMTRLLRVLEAIEAAQALLPLVSEGPGGATPLDALDDALSVMAQITAGAGQRFDGAEGLEEAAMSRAAASPMSLVALRMVRDHAEDTAELERSIAAALGRARREVPPAVADVVGRILPRLLKLPLDRPSAPSSIPPPTDIPLPAWIPSRRTLGGFYVQRQLGGGALGSVFVVNRVEERHEPRAERFALKVPEYNATAARSVSEAEFLKLFREEAGALLAIPEHPNLARFVTFDAGAKPKPILVMELVEGATCERLLAAKRLTLGGAIHLLEGVLAGLEAMHARGVGHLDSKPTNIIVREGREAVLVDFGLAGAHIRPGCASGCYGAPEVWGALPPDTGPTPMTADVYSFGCLAYEIMTAQTLFDGPSEVALISAHLTHDGMPPGVRRLAAEPALEPLAMLLFHCLRHRPADRMSAAQLRAELKRVAQSFVARSWPVGAAS